MITAVRPSPARIAFTIVPSTLGLVLVAHEAPASGIIAVLLGDDEHAMTAELAERFPGAELTHDAESRECTDLADRVLALVGAPAAGGELPLDVRGTPFQRSVWEALRAIPAGETVSYTELAARIGRPRSVRAVAAACAANHIAIAIPCHRVVRSNGDLSGYRWGVARKRALLESEGALLGRSRRPAAVA